MKKLLILSLTLLLTIGCDDSESQPLQGHPEQAQFDRALASCESQTENSEINFYVYSSNLTLNYASPMAMDLLIGADTDQRMVQQPFEMVLTSAAPITFRDNSAYCERANCAVSSNGQKLTIKDTATVSRQWTQMEDQSVDMVAPYHVPVSLLTTDDGIESLSADINVRMRLLSDQQDANTCDNLNVFRYQRAGLDLPLKYFDSEAHSELVVGEYGALRLDIDQILTKEEYYRWSKQIPSQVSKQNQSTVKPIDTHDNYGDSYTRDSLEGAYLDYVLPEFLVNTNSFCRGCLNSKRVLDLGQITSSGRLLPNIWLNYKSVDTGAGFIDINLKHKLTGDKIYQTYRFPIFVGESTALIQQKIDEARAGSTIVIHRGLYVGSLDLTSKNIHLTSASADSQVTIIGKSAGFISMLPRLIDNRIYLAAQSSISGLTLHNFTIHTSGGGTLRDNVFSFEPHAQGETTISVNNDFIFENNIIMDTYRNNAPDVMHIHGYDFQKSPRFSQINYLDINLYGNKYETSQVSINNNLFVVAPDRVKSKDYLKPPSYDSVPAAIEIKSKHALDIKVQNNTFVGMSSVLGITTPSDEDDGGSASQINLAINNNIFKDVEYLFGDHMGVEQATTDLRIIADLRNNLFSEPSHHMDRFDMENTLVESPLLTDDFKLSPLSPAIDAGFDNGLLEDNANRSRPSDGDNDGTFIHDIGAFEYSGTINNE